MKRSSSTNSSPVRSHSAMSTDSPLAPLAAPSRMCVSATSIDFVFDSTYLFTLSSASMRPRNLTTGLCEDVGFVVVSFDELDPDSPKLAAPPSSISYSRSLSA